MARRKSKRNQFSADSITENVPPKNLFHITIGAGVQRHGKLEPTDELRLLKAALLYGDKVKLCSLTSSMLFPFALYKYFPEDEKLEVVSSLLLEIFKTQNEDNYPEQIDAIMDLAKTLQENRGLKKQLKATLPHKEFLMVHKLDKEFRQMMNKSMRDFGNTFAQISDKMKFKEIEAALESGLLEFHWIQPGGDQDKVIKEYLDVISEAVTSGQTYPLFDDMTGDYVNAAIKENKIVPSDISSGRAKHIGLSANLLSRLPLFEYASVSEVLDIRQELQKPLIRFRSAMIDFSTEIENAAWDEQFPQECEQIFYQRVAPAVLEIEEACKSNKRLMVYFDKIVDEKLIAGATVSMLGVLLGSATVGGVAAAAGATRILSKAHEAEKEWREKNESIQKNQLYLYYKTGDLLQKTK
jgi:hypothetical protein